jgi:pseudaminic acid cytidylyltransferase
MIAHSIMCALRSRLFDRVIVSTDDDEIANVAQEYGAEVPFRRPATLSDDHAGTTEVIAHVVSLLRSGGADPDAVCCLYATAPFVRERDLVEALEKLEAGTWRYVFAATTFAYPIFRSFRTNSSDGVEMYYPDYFHHRSQDLPEALHDAGQFYWGRAEAWIAREVVFDAHSSVVKVPRWLAQDIDTPEDWEQAELLFQMLRRDDPVI